MALVKKIELELHGELGMRRGFYIGLFNSNGDAYNFSEGINFPAANGEYQDGIKTTTSEFTLNNDPVGSVTVAPAQKYGEMSACLDPGQRSFMWWRGNDRSPWASNMLCFLFGARTDQPGPWKIILTFSKAIDIYNVAIFQDEALGGRPIGDLEVKIIGENQAVLASTVYTAQQQSLDYPKEVISTLTPEIPFSAPFAPLNIKPTLPALPKTIKVINKDGRIYIKPKQA